MWGRVSRLRLLLGHLGAVPPIVVVVVFGSRFKRALPAVRPSVRRHLPYLRRAGSLRRPVRPLHSAICGPLHAPAAMALARRSLRRSIHPLHDSIVHPTGPTRVLLSRVRHSGQGHAREALRGQKQNRGGVRKGGPLTDSGCGPGLTQRRRLPKRRRHSLSVEHWWPPRDREPGSKWNN